MNHLTSLENARFNMIEQQIRPWNVLDSRVLQLLAQLHREDFVPKEHQSLAFSDFELPLGYGQTMLSPKVEARLLQDLQITPNDKVLEIGTGSGYTAGLLGRMAHHVTTLEIIPELAEQAALNLARAVVVNVDVKVMDGSQMHNISGEFDVILLSGSVAQIPMTLVDRLTLGGRLAAIVGNDPIMQTTVVRRTAQGVETTTPWDTVAPRLRGFPEHEAFSF